MNKGLLVFIGFFFSFAPLQAAEYPHREIEVKIAVSPVFQYSEDWEKDVRNRLIFVNKIFEPLFNIHFKIVQNIDWEPQDETRETDLLMEELRSFIPIKQDQIVIGFHRMSQPFKDDKVVDVDTVGSAQFFRGFIVIRDPFVNMGTIRKEVVLAHEITHLFGGVHISDPNAIMHPKVPLNPSLILDKDNQEIIAQTRAVDFQKGLESLSDESVDQVIKIYEKGIRENPNSDFYYHLGKFYHHRKQIPKAVVVWEEALHHQYENPHIHFELGNFYYQSGRYALAVRELGSAIAHFILPSQKKQLADTLNYLGVAYYQQDNLDLAIFNWLKGLAADPDNFILQGNLALAYLQRGDIERGVGELEKLVVKNPGDITTISNLGTAYLKDKKYDKAAEFLEKALERKLKGISAGSDTSKGSGAIFSNEISESAIRLNLGAAYLNLKRYEAALQELEKSRAAEPKVYEVHLNLIQVYLYLNRHEEAIKEIQEALRYKQNDPYLYAFQAQALMALGRPEEAIRSAREGLRYTSTQDDLAVMFHRNIGITYLNQQRYSEALEELNKAVNLQWKDAETHAFLGLLYAQTGKKEKALQSLKTALSFDAKNANAKAFLKKIETHSKMS